VTAGARRRRLPLAYRFAALVLRPLLMRVTKRDWRGVENIPAEGGFVVSTNHISYADPLVFAHFMLDSGREAYFLGKDSLFAIPVVGWLLKKCGQIPVYRNSTAAADAYRAAVEGVRAGKALGIFPEGTITRDPDLWPMRGKTGAARIALATGCPVIPVAQWGVQDLLAPYAKKPDLFPRKRITYRAGDPVPLDDLLAREASNQVTLEATERIMTAITALLEEIRGAKAPAIRYDPRATGTAEIGNPNKKKKGRRP
jgi:1-acyl-sn-glycerol-3-phosphate acyltransferase